MTIREISGPVAGVDGCRSGWVVVHCLPGEAPGTAVHRSVAGLIEGLPPETLIAVDMPIGLPERTGHGGRGPEALVRRHLGERQSSVFSIPSRSAIYAATQIGDEADAWSAAHRRASAIARQTSDPPRGVSIQAFGLFAKMREIDRLLIARPALRARILESHPEAAFWRLNDESAMTLPKKIKGRINPAGMIERRMLLERHGFAHDFLEAAPPTGAGDDDFLDAAALLLVAQRHARGEAVPFPDPPLIDALGIPIAIWT